jgi:hypothetical protein
MKIMSGTVKAAVIIEELKEAGFIFKGPAAVGSRFLGVEEAINENGAFWSQRLLASSLSVPDRPCAHPLPLNVEKEDIQRQIAESQPCTTKQHARFRHILGSLMYLQITRPDLLFALSFHSRHVDKPTQYALKLLEQTAQYAKTTADRGIVFPSRLGRLRGLNNGTIIPPYCRTQYPQHFTGRWHFNLVTDATFSSNPTSAHIITLNDMPIAYRSYAQRRVSPSSTSAELYAYYDGVDLTKLLCAFASELGMCNVEGGITGAGFTDSKDLTHWIASVNPRPGEQSLRPIIVQLQTMTDGTLQTPTNNRCIDLDPPAASAEEIVVRRGAVECGRWKKGQERIVNIHRSAMAHLLADVRLPTFHIAGIDNPADLLTKPLRMDALYALCVHEAACFDAMPTGERELPPSSAPKHYAIKDAHDEDKGEAAVLEYEATYFGG